MQPIIVISLIFAIGGQVVKAAVNLDKYPIRYVDRPYTLPVGVHNFEMALAGTVPIYRTRLSTDRFFCHWA
jgi:hypothetical protein